MPAIDLDELRAGDVEGIKAAFGNSAKVYAPYVLLRTFALWRERETITLPSDIRLLLEATYVDSSQSEPPAWRQLHEELEAKKRKLQTRAIANSKPWQLALADEEGIQTRWNSNPTVAVLLVHKVFAWDTKNGARLELLNGAICVLKQEDFSFETAKAIHRNLVKVPKWSVKRHVGPTQVGCVSICGARFWYVS